MVEIETVMPDEELVGDEETSEGEESEEENA